MLTNDLFGEVLIQPAVELGSGHLNIVSGYASPSMVDWHFQEIAKNDCEMHLNLIVGMTKKEGIIKEKHLAFVEATNKYNFDCRYIAKGKPVHTKVFVWLKTNKPVMAYSGSANYTLNGFSGDQQEVLCRCNPIDAQNFFNLMFKDSISCKDPKIEEEINLIEHRTQRQLLQLNTVTLSLLDSQTNETHNAGGLNWGQREKRDSNQAYLPVPSKIYKSDFFPPIKQRFNVLTDDGEMFIFARAQQHGKALHTPLGNNLMGLYFRARIGVRSGEFVKKEDLLKYGRTDVHISKVDDNNYFLDFSIDSK